MAKKTAKPIETDILCIGAGVASLSTALALLRWLKAKNCVKLPRVMIIDKGRNVGSHALSGAVIDMSGFMGLLTADEIRKIPIEARVNGNKESFHMLFEKHSMKLPWMPPMMKSHGYPVGSLTKLTQYLSGLCEKEGAKVCTGFAATELIEDNTGRIIGARTGEKGIDREGKPKSNYLPSETVYAKTVVLGEGACGILTQKLIKGKGLEGDREQSYALGIKEIIEIPADEKRVGEIAHTFGYPADTTTYGGGFIYHVSPAQVMICYVYALDYANPEADTHLLFRKFKAQPMVAEHISGGKATAYGAKVIPEGGYYSTPEVVADGALIVGDGAGLVDTLRIKGIHLAAQSGRAAAETLAECWLNNDFSHKALSAYGGLLKKTEGWKQLCRVRNVRAPFSTHLALGMMCAGTAWATFGAFPFWQVPMEADWKALNSLPGGKTHIVETIAATLESPDRLTDVFMSGAIHDEDQPCHLKIRDRARCVECIKKYGAPCRLFCPAEVYRLEEDQIHIDFSNCLHCKTCQIKDPYRNIEWTFPQGGDGPRYTRM